MLKAFEEVKKNVSFKYKPVQIDGPLFKLHYRFTFVVLLISTILVSSQQYIGEHIRCIADKGVDEKVINTFCFFTSTFTVVRHLNASVQMGGMAPHPGVGPMQEDDEIIRHAYYQWVPFFLFGQALLFYIPHMIWKKIEGGRIKTMVAGFEFAALASSDSAVKMDDKRSVPSSKQLHDKIESVSTAFAERLEVNKTWAWWMIFCEVLSLLNVVVQLWAMDAFLGGRFLDIGSLLMGDEDPENPRNPMDIIFPKVTKCTFHKYGPSGSIQQHDAMCVMALNVINEKIYAFLWFWFIILLVLTSLGLIYRFISMILFSRSQAFNRFVFKACCPVTLDPMSMNTITTSCTYSVWVFLHYLALSMDGFVFSKLFDELALFIEDSVPKRRLPSLNEQEMEPLKGE